MFSGVYIGKFRPFAKVGPYSKTIKEQRVDTLENFGRCRLGVKETKKEDEGNVMENLVKRKN